jgi:serine phosphatase RsbU (regulator of sigma subunit)/anti-sigma regulatory factor (Ser/Thr protein kinase)
MSGLQEFYKLDTPADLAFSREAVVCVLSWLRLQGYSQELLKTWRLPLTEAVNNAIIHGCAGKVDACVNIATRVSTAGAEVTVRDPGYFLPPPESAELNEDLLLEHGRGGFLIAQCTDSFEHRNDGQGHSLILRWKKVPETPMNVTSVADTERTLDQLAVQLGDAFETVTAYGYFAGLLATTSDFEELLSKVRVRVADALPHEYFVLRFYDGDSLVLGAAADGFPRAIPGGKASVEAKVAMQKNCAAFASPAAIPAGDPLAIAQGPLVVVAVACPNKKRGSLTLIRGKDAPAYSAGQIAFTQAVADFLGTAQSLSELWAQRAEQVKTEQELQFAAQIQQQLFPQRPPSLVEWKVAGACQPSRAMGGDYYDWMVCNDGSCLVLVADVMGKGMPAALVASILRSTWRALSVQAEDPGDLLSALNAQLASDLFALEVFITAVLVKLPPSGGALRYANAGHCGLLHRSGQARAFHHHGRGGPPLGIDAAVRYESARIELSRGDWLFAFSDGCYEFDRKRGSAAGLEVLEHELLAAIEQGPVNLVPRLLRRLHDLTAGELPDDCTVVSICRSQ